MPRRRLPSGWLTRCGGTPDSHYLPYLDLIWGITAILPCHKVHGRIPHMSILADEYRHAKHEAALLAVGSKAGVSLTGISMQARGGSDALAQQFARMTLAGLPRGGGDGDAIRHGILNVMRENGIREGHRPVSLTMPCTPPRRIGPRQ